MASPRQWRDRLQPNHISKMVLPTVNLGPPDLTKSRTFSLKIQTGAVGGGDVKSNDAELASQGRRLAGAVLDGFLFVLTLGIGWVIWYLIVAARRTEPSEATPAYARYP